MSIEVERATVPCTVCGAHVTELRRGRCWGCYTQWSEMRPVGRGATCTICNERRRDYLRLIEVNNRTLTMCHGCASRTMKMGDVPETLEDLRRALCRDRRSLDRRGLNLDRRIFPRERRAGDRRDASGGRGDTDPRFALPDLDDVIIELSDADIEEVEQTVVRERPRPKA
jgi:hypothetical protein